MAIFRAPKQYLGVRAKLPPDLQIATRDPNSGDTAYVIGTLWLNKTGLNSFQWSGASWISLGTSATGSVDTLTASSGGAILPSAGNINLLGTANQITTAGAGSTITFTIPATFVAPGSIEATTTLKVTGTSTLGNITADGTINLNTASAGATTIATLGTGATSIGNATGNTAIVGDLNVGTGNISLTTIGKKIIIPTGVNASAGTSGVMSGTPGVVTVATTACSATALVFYSRATTGGTPGEVSITAQDGTGFTLTSTGNETSTFNWWIINA